MTVTEVPGKRLFFEPDDYFSNLIADIDAAAQEIILEIYIFHLDRVGARVLDALARAVERGVRLRLLLDGVGSYIDAREIAARLENRMAEVKIFHPLPWDFSAYRNALYSDRWYSQLLYFLASINRRNHRKLCIVDRQIAWLGSFNITANHVAHDDPEAEDYWHDTGLRLGGPLVGDLCVNFELVWRRKAGRFRDRSRHFLARESVSRRRLERLQLLHLLQASTRRIWITNAYFNPNRRLLKMLIGRARAGVSVQLIVPSRSDVIFFPALSRSFYRDLLQAGIRVFEYQQRILHSKTMLIDQQALIGSTNLNHRSLRHDLEVDALLDEEAIVQRMEERFFADLEDCREITLRQHSRHPALQPLASLVARFLRYWL